MSDDWWVSPVDGHRHAARLVQGGADGPDVENCAVCALEAERDRLRAVMEAALLEHDRWAALPLVPPPDKHNNWVLAHEALHEAVMEALDVSGDMGRGATPCEWCHGSGRKFLTDDELANLCGSPANNGPCILPRGHNMGQVDIPEKHWSGRGRMPDDVKQYFADRHIPRSQPEMGQWVARLRAERGWTQAELATLIRRSESWVSQVERGVRHVDRLSLREELQDALAGAAPEDESAVWGLPNEPCAVCGSSESHENGHPVPYGWGKWHAEVEAAGAAPEDDTPHDLPVCSVCGTPYTWARRFNNGAPRDFPWPACECEASAPNEFRDPFDPGPR